jgi:hypothetical protein
MNENLRIGLGAASSVNAALLPDAMRKSAGTVKKWNKPAKLGEKRSEIGIFLLDQLIIGEFSPRQTHVF